MKIVSKYLKVSKRARYATYGNLSPKTKYFWFALHGTKMLCDQMLYKFEKFDPDEHFVVAPEGLSRFYLKGFGGDVVATWMTSRDRLEEIEDLSNYLSQLFQKYNGQLNVDCKKIILGFSQGGTTAFRWLHSKPVEFDQLIAYSCWIPEDIDLRMCYSKLDAIIYTWGRQDQFLVADRIKMVEDVISKNDLTVHFEPYKGDHRVDKKNLAHLFEKYIRYPSR